MKFPATIFLLILSLGACSPHPGTSVSSDESKHAIFYKKGVSDRQSTRDLNECSLLAFKKAVDAQTPVDEDEAATKKRCMTSRGYEAFYN